MTGRAARYLSGHCTDLAIVLTALAIVLVLASNLIDLQNSRTVLQATIAEQQKAVANTGKVEAQLEALATGTQDLAARGNGNARRIVDTLKQNGISINTKRSNP